MTVAKKSKFSLEKKRLNKEDDADEVSWKHNYKELRHVVGALGSILKGLRKKEMLVVV